MRPSCATLSFTSSSELICCSAIPRRKYLGSNVHMRAGRRKLRFYLFALRVIGIDPDSEPIGHKARTKCGARA
jgi:hypothetical protein